MQSKHRLTLFYLPTTLAVPCKIGGQNALKLSGEKKTSMSSIVLAGWCWSLASCKKYGPPRPMILRTVEREEREERKESKEMKEGRLHLWLCLHLRRLHLWLCLHLRRLHLWLCLHLRRLHLWLCLHLRRLHLWLCLHLRRLWPRLWPRLCLGRSSMIMWWSRLCLHLRRLCPRLWSRLRLHLRLSMWSWMKIVGGPQMLCRLGLHMRLCLHLHLHLRLLSRLSVQSVQGVPASKRCTNSFMTRTRPRCTTRPPCLNSETS
jgi:hypothetical protein